MISEKTREEIVEHLRESNCLCPEGGSHVVLHERYGGKFIESNVSYHPTFEKYGDGIYRYHYKKRSTGRWIFVPSSLVEEKEKVERLVSEIYGYTL